jgi:excisionase family DNA binding protein
MDENKQYWTTSELADAASVTQGWIRKLLRAGKVDGFKAGRDWLIEEEEALRYLHERGEVKADA